MGHNLRLAGTFLYDSAAPFPDVAVPFQTEWNVDLGSTSGKANRAFVYLTDAIAASGTLDIDLSQMSGPAGTFAPEYLHAAIVWCVTPGGKGTLTKNGTNGWTGMGTDYTIPVSTGPFVLTSDAGIAITSTNKVMTLTNTSGAAAKFQIYALLRDT